MFDIEATLYLHKKKIGAKKAVEFIADINRYTDLRRPSQKNTKGLAKPALDWSRTLFDYNEHFIELSNIGEEGRSTVFMLVCMLAFMVLMSIGGAIFLSAGLSFDMLTVAIWVMPVGAIAFCWAMWPHQITPNFFTLLRARYRFNRTTRKVYVLRPDRYGGNVILDWDRVQAHPNWCAPREMSPDEIDDKYARQRRQEDAGGELRIRGLVLYWPPFDPSDPERKGEDVLWVGPKLSGENLWQYIRTFMEEGPDKVPVPNEQEWLRKGFHSPSQHIEETELGPSRVLDEISGRGRNSVQTKFLFMSTMIWAPLHCLAERLCRWPTFPEEWNSDCGQKRREDGIGPEEPLRWAAVRDTGRKQQGESVAV
ncbi:MFS transporter [Cupriavidus taiwanensis]|uniref:MFS transporter n=1 Tax=Cupriavidus taiwanensis TaxID=164546 RepID=UPI0015729A7C|nr:MFS transporter [Cupriavidus taiwanensis]NSX15939.1 MFS transporter [Cupriavidus taiwanensis]